MTFCGGKAAWDWNREVGEEAQPVRHRPTTSSTCGDCLQSQLTIALGMPFAPNTQRHRSGLSNHGYLNRTRLLMIMFVHREQEDERRAFAQLALHPDYTAVRLNDVSCNS